MAAIRGKRNKISKDYLLYIFVHVLTYLKVDEEVIDNQLFL